MAKNMKQNFANKCSEVSCNIDLKLKLFDLMIRSLMFLNIQFAWLVEINNRNHFVSNHIGSLVRDD